MCRRQIFKTFIGFILDLHLNLSLNLFSLSFCLNFGYHELAATHHTILECFEINSYCLVCVYGLCVIRTLIQMLNVMFNVLCFCILSVSNPSVFYTVLNTLFFYMNEHAKTSKLFFFKKKIRTNLRNGNFFFKFAECSKRSRKPDMRMAYSLLLFNFFFLIIYYWNFLFAKIFRLHFCHFLTFLLVLICYKIILKRAHNPWVESVCRLSNFFSSFFVVLIFEKL